MNSLLLNVHVEFCPNEQPSFEPFMSLDLVSER